MNNKTKINEKELKQNKSDTKTQKVSADKKKNQVKTQKVNYKLKYESSKKDIENLNSKIKELILENNKNISAFQEKAAGFQSKAQEEINKVKAELLAKSEEDSIEMRKYGAQRLLENILEPISNIDLAVSVGEKQDDSGVLAYVQGFKMLMGQLSSELEGYGVTEISPVVGDEYDPELHQAFATEEGETKNTISQVKKKGYKLHDRVIKPAVVVVIK